MRLIAWARRVRSRRAALSSVLFALVVVALPAPAPVTPAHSQTHARSDAQTHALSSSARPATAV